MANPDIRWRQRFQNLQFAYAQLQHALQVNAQDPQDDLIQMAVIKAFEMTFELSWKVLKDFLEYQGRSVKLPREVIKQAYADDVLKDGDIWIAMLDERNLMAHVYDQARAQLAIARISQQYFPAIKHLHDDFQLRLV
jgi:hypothetical protein